MTAHVAEAGESRGRVILRFSTGMANDYAIEAAMHVARAYQSEVETLFVEDSQIVDLAGFSFAREIPLRGGASRPISARQVRTGFKCAFAVARRRVADAAARAEVPVYEKFVQDEPVQALASACAQKGPWNVIALAEAFGALGGATIEEVFDTVNDATGVLLVGPNTRSVSGDVVVVVEDTQTLPAMLRAGERMAQESEQQVVLLLTAVGLRELEQMDGEVRLLLGERTDIQIAHADLSHGDEAVVAEAIRRKRAGFLIAQYGGLAVPRGMSLRPLAVALRCPLLLVR